VVQAAVDILGQLQQQHTAVVAVEGHLALIQLLLDKVVLAVVDQLAQYHHLIVAAEFQELLALVAVVDLREDAVALAAQLAEVAMEDLV
jgi:hypothetical protein